MPRRPRSHPWVTSPMPRTKCMSWKHKKGVSSKIWSKYQKGKKEKGVQRKLTKKENSKIWPSMPSRPRSQPWITSPMPRTKCMSWKRMETGKDASVGKQKEKKQKQKKQRKHRKRAAPMLGGWVNPHREQQTIPQGQTSIPPKSSPRQRPTAKARHDQAALAASAKARWATQRARPRRKSLYAFRAGRGPILGWPLPCQARNASAKGRKGERTQ